MLFEDKETPFSETNIRRAYEASLERLARLFSFANSLATGMEGDVESRQAALAVDDLTVFAINARRLIAETKCSHLATSVEIPRIKFDGTQDSFVFFKTGDTVPVSRMINAILHHVWIEIYRDSRQARRILSPRRPTLEEDLEQIMSHKTHYYFPKIAVQSDWPKDDPPIYFVELKDFLVLFTERVMNPMVEICADKSIFLEEFYRI